MLKHHCDRCDEVDIDSDLRPWRHVHVGPLDPEGFTEHYLRDKVDGSMKRLWTKALPVTYHLCGACHSDLKLFLQERK